MDWVSFWDGAHAIYVNPRHKQVHYAALAADLMAYVPGPTARVMDYGCGEALAADQLAAACGRLALCEAAPGVREKLMARFGATSKIDVLSPEAAAALPAGCQDLVIANSLVQYLSRDQFRDLLTLWHRLLAPGGHLLVADIIPPNVSAVRDAAALLGFAAREGFLAAAVIGLARTAVSPYRKLRAELGLAHYEEAEVLDLLTAAGFSPARVHPNIGHNQNRMAFHALRR